MKRAAALCLAVLLVLSVTACSPKQEEQGNHQNRENQQNTQQSKDLIDPAGTTLETRISTPEGYHRTETKAGSFTEFLRKYELKEDGSPVLLYDGSKKGVQDAHAAVFKLPIENADLQQCADSIMRVYAEYLYGSGQAEKIAFHFTNGFLAEYSKWREGYRIQVSGNDVSYIKSASYDDSYDCFKKYLRMVFSYAGTLSMANESAPAKLSELKPGDIFIKGGSPGHVVMVADVCVDAEGKKAFLLAQGYMPAQEFHVIRNPRHEEDPWYYEQEVVYPFETAQWTFTEGSFRSLPYLE